MGLFEFGSAGNLRNIANVAKAFFAEFFIFINYFGWFESFLERVNWTIGTGMNHNFSSLDNVSDNNVGTVFFSRTTMIVIFLFIGG